MNRMTHAAVFAALLVGLSPSVLAVDTPADATADEEKTFTPPPGFKTREKDGQTVYCRARAPVGTKIRNWECYTQAEMIQVSEAMRRSNEDLKQRGRLCDRGQMCSGG